MFFENAAAEIVITDRLRIEQIRTVYYRIDDYISVMWSTKSYGPNFYFRRPLAQKAADIGVWYFLLDFMGTLAVVTNVRKRTSYGWLYGVNFMFDIWRIRLDRIQNMSLGSCLQTTEKTLLLKKLNFSNHNWPADLSLQQQNMFSKYTLHSIESRPQKLKTVHKCSRTLISLLQRTTSQITPPAFTLEKPKLFTASSNARTARITRIARIS